VGGVKFDGQSAPFRNTPTIFAAENEIKKLPITSTIHTASTATAPQKKNYRNYCYIGYNFLEFLCTRFRHFSYYFAG